MKPWDGRIVDIHTHIFPDALAERALKALMAECSEVKNYTDGTLAGLRGAMKQAGCGRAVAAMIATKPSQTVPIVSYCEVLRAEEDIIPFPSVHPSDPQASEWVAQFAGRFKGIKLHPHYQGVAIDDPGVVAIVKTAAEAGLPVLVHAGQDPAFPGDMKCEPARLANLLDQAPGAKIIAAHLGGWLDWDAVMEIIAGREGVWIDTAASLPLMEDDTILALIEKHGVGHVVFASDSPWGDPAEDRRRLESLGLDDDTLSSIFFKNAEALLGLG